MKSDCPPVESFERLLRLHPADPRREHLGRCPRCRARAIAFRSFLESGPLPQGANLAAARDGMTKTLQAEIRGPVAFARLPRWRPRLSRPWAAVAFSGAIAAVLLVLVSPTLLKQRDDVLLRGAPATQAQLVLLPAETLPDGALLLRWHPLPGAESYRVTLFGQNLEELAQVSAGAAEFLEIPAGNLAALGPRGSALFWRVEALVGGDPVALSAPASLSLP